MRILFLVMSVRPWDTFEQAGPYKLPFPVDIKPEKGCVGFIRAFDSLADAEAAADGNEVAMVMVKEEGDVAE